MDPITAIALKQNAIHIKSGAMYVKISVKNGPKNITKNITATTITSFSKNDSIKTYYLPAVFKFISENV